MDWLEKLDPQNPEQMIVFAAFIVFCCILGFFAFSVIGLILQCAVEKLEGDE